MGITIPFLISILEKRFIEHKERHPDLDWGFVKLMLTSNENTLTTIGKMEETGGESYYSVRGFRGVLKIWKQ